MCWCGVYVRVYLGVGSLLKSLLCFIQGSEKSKIDFDFDSVEIEMLLEESRIDVFFCHI